MKLRETWWAIALVVGVLVRAVTVIDGSPITRIDGDRSPGPRLRRGMMTSLSSFDTWTARTMPRGIVATC